MARRLLLLNGLAVLGVVLNHATAWGFTAMFWWTDRYLPVAVPYFDQLNSLAYYALRVIEQIVAFTVPGFLFVSGFFIAFVTGRGQKTNSWHIVSSRIKTLLIPYLIWSALILTARFVEGQRLSAAEIIQSIAFGRTAAPYYYIPLLIQLYILSPFLVAAAKKRWRALLVITALLQLSIQCLYYLSIIGVGEPAVRCLASLTPAWFFPTKVFWFVLGIVVCLHLQAFKPWLARTKRWWLAGLAVFLVIGLWEWETLLQASGKPWIPYRDTALDSLYALAFILCFLAYDQISLPFVDQLGGLGAKSYGVYLVHAPAQEFAARAVAIFLPWLLAYQILFQPLLWIAGLGIPLLLMTIVKRTPARRFYQTLFG